MKHKTQHPSDFVGFGTSVRLSFQQKLNPISSKQMVIILIKSLVLQLRSKIGFSILRIKVFLKSSAGYIKADITHVNGEVFTESTMKEGIRKAELIVNIVAQGLIEEEVKAIFKEAMEKTLTPFNGRFSISRGQINKL